MLSQYSIQRQEFASPGLHEEPKCCCVSAPVETKENCLGILTSFDRKGYENTATGPAVKDKAVLKLNIEAGILNIPLPRECIE